MEELTTSPGAVSEVFTTLGQELGIAFKEHFEQLMNHLDATELLAITDEEPARRIARIAAILIMLGKAFENGANDNDEAEPEQGEN